MNCPFCNAANDDQNTFCVSCGRSVVQDQGTQEGIVPPTRYIPDPNQSPPSVDTVYPPSVPGGFNPSPVFGGVVPQQPVKSGKGWIFAAVFLFLLLLIVVGVAAGIYFWQMNPTVQAETFPDHLGLFVQNSDRNQVAELGKRDVANFLEEQDKLASDTGLPKWEKGASLILFANAQDIPVTDLKLIPIDAAADDGKIRQIDFQAVPIEGRPDMKRLRLPDAVPDGKYAFVILDGFLDEGKHKVWPFQVRGQGTSELGGLAREMTVPLKEDSDKKPEEKEQAKVAPKQPIAPPPAKAEPPVGSKVAFCNGNNVLLRASPSLSGRKIGSLKRGQRIFVLRYSDNYDNWRGTVANWAYVQTEGGGRGWVFTPFVNY